MKLLNNVLTRKKIVAVLILILLVGSNLYNRSYGGCFFNGTYHPIGSEWQEIVHHDALGICEEIDESLGFECNLAAFGFLTSVDGGFSSMPCRVKNVFPG